ncbi:hypothetical protein [Nocardia asiatica]|uniref:hypothetical protein n=1 Tax=Nocardia asiatica TaxID=209252 RepID=UPI002458EC5C|nr:hypothetical protein [Nocardia asiatica]
MDIIALIDNALEDDETGPDAMRWRPHPAVEPRPNQDLRAGDVVEYHGSIILFHWDEFVVVSVGYDGRLTLVDHYYPTTRLKQVRQSSVTATGRWVPICRCEHPYVHPAAPTPGVCSAVGCQCPHHPQ